ncbi:hypothetical protein Hjap01_02340 [Haloarcula japonica]
MITLFLELVFTSKPKGRKYSPERHTLTNQYEGTVWVEDNDLTGTIFSVELPLDTDTASETAQSEIISVEIFNTHIFLFVDYGLVPRVFWI